MEIYTYPKSRSLRVLWTMEETGAPYQSIKVDLVSSDPVVTSPHPQGKVPYLVDEDISISETLAICLYLCEKYRATSLYPLDAKERALVNQWLSFSLTELESPVWGLLKLMVFTPKNQRSADLVTYFRNEVVKTLSMVQMNDNHQWICGENFTLADIFMAHNLLWAKLCGIDVGENIERYVERAMGRPAFLQAQERNNR